LRLKDANVDGRLDQPVLRSRIHKLSFVQWPGIGGNISGPEASWAKSPMQEPGPRGLGGSEP
jgi:hypothetical protein